MKNKKEVTIYDIAAELNVSPSTVSRALKGHYSIGKKTIKTVKELAIKRGYQPNTLAAGLRSNKTNTIGVITPWINRPFISSLISGIEGEAKLSGHNVIISQSHDLYENEVANAKALYASRIGGLVVSLAMETTRYDHFSQFIDNNIPVVFVDRVTNELNSDSVVIDNYTAGFNAVQHLIEQGCRRIAHVGGAQQRNIYSERRRGFIDALTQNSIPIDDDLNIQNDVLSSEEGFKIAERLLKLPNPPDGIFCANDTSAVSIIQYAKQQGVNIPEDLAIIGFNNDPVAQIVEPQLSTVAHPSVDMGRLAARQVLKHKADLDLVASQTLVLNTELIIRASSQRRSSQKLNSDPGKVYPDDQENI